MPYLVAADTGGTFTDVAVYDPEAGRIRFGKTLTTYGKLVDGVVTGMREAQVAPAATASLRHGTTHVINAFLQRQALAGLKEFGNGEPPKPSIRQPTKQRRRFPTIWQERYLVKYLQND